MINIKSEYTLQDVRITPKSISNITSRGETNPFYTDTFGEKVLPIISSPMAYFTPDALFYVINKYPELKNKFVYTLPRFNPNFELLKKNFSKKEFNELLEVFKTHDYPSNYYTLDEYYKYNHTLNDIDIRISWAKFLSDNGILFIPTIGLSDIDYALEKPTEKVKKVIELINLSNTGYYLIDIANGYMRNVISIMDYLATFVDKTPIFGNIVSGEIFYEHSFFHSANFGVRIGIGNGSECLTTVNTAIGRPQLSALIDVYKNMLKITEKSDNSIILISDGGVRSYADAIIALLFSDFVMTNYLFKNTELNIHALLSDSETTVHYGMASKYAKSNPDEYIEGDITYGRKQNIKEILTHFEASLRSTMSYLGILSIYDLEYIQLKDKIELVSTNSGSLRLQEITC